MKASDPGEDGDSARIGVFTVKNLEEETPEILPRSENCCVSMLLWGEKSQK